MRASTKKQLQELLSHLEFPSCIFIYETGRVIAINEPAVDILGEKLKNIKHMFAEEFRKRDDAFYFSNSSHTFFGQMIEVKKNKLTIDVEFNCMEQDEHLHLVVALFDYSYKQCFIRNNVGKVPRIIWKKRNMEYIGMNKVARADYNMDEAADFNEIMSGIFEEQTQQTLESYENAVMDTKKEKFEVYQMLSTKMQENYFVKFHYLPLMNRYDTSIGVIAVYERVLNREEYKKLYDLTAKQNDLLSEVISRSESILISWIWDEYITIEYVSNNINTLGFNIEDLYNKKTKWKDIFFPQEYRALKKFVKNTNDWPTDVIEVDCRVRTPNGPIIWVHTKTIIIRKRGEATQFETMISDITEKKLLIEQLDETNRALEMNTDSLKKVFDNLNSYIFIVDQRTHRLVFVNQKVAKQFGFIPINQRMDDFLRYHDIILYHSNRQYSNQYLEECIENGVSYMTFYDRENKLLLDAQMARVELRGAKNAIVIHMHDITDMISPGRNQKFALDNDYLTGLHNQRRLDKDLDQLFEETKQQNSKYYFFYIDLDEFHAVQNRLGDEYADLLLQKVAGHFKQMAEIQEYTYRVAGDKFYVLASYSIGEEIKDKIYDVFQKDFTLMEETVSCTASIGICFLTKEITSKRELFGHVKNALGNAKKQGGNCCCYYKTDEQDKSQEHLIMEDELKKAVKEGCEKFEVYYQPIMDTLLESVTSVEALLRWNDKKLGQVKSKYFIPIAESLGIMVPLGEYLLKQSFKMSRDLDDLGYDIKVHINLSKDQVIHPDFINSTISLANEFKVRRENIVFEIVECVSCEKKKYMQERLRKLRNAGFLLAYDRFQGAVSLPDMIQIPFSYVKLSNNLFDKFGTKEFNPEMISGLIRFVHAMDLKTIVMGIESKEQMELVASLDGDMQQGYFFKQPLESEKLIEYIKNHS